ncbi:hypothetical protein DR64_8032 [Paraburkholderia xenovorans LB400]|nr:hypothetical protein DR64_8032 [Paraburkholderia xenovorans LB400]
MVREFLLVSRLPSDPTRPGVATAAPSRCEAVYQEPPLSLPYCILRNSRLHIDQDHYVNGMLHGNLILDLET